MISKTELGRRMREIRLQKGMTLKQLDDGSGFSATHISEIERGKTSPTVGALIRIASALGKEPSYFIEEEVLPEIAMTPRDQREKVTLGNAPGESLTPGIPGGRLYAYFLRIRPDQPAVELPRMEGEEGGFVLTGDVEFEVDGEAYRLSAGDAIHHAGEESRRIRALGIEPAELVLVSTCRLSS